nr:MAG TPA: hypothetical protein [Crassvirales sp.]
MRNVTIVESNVEPNKEHLWFYNGKLKWFGPNGWEDICVCKSPSPSSTTTTTPPPTTTTAPSTFKLINNTGDTLDVSGVGYVNGIISTTIPPVPNGGSVLLIKAIEHINLQSHSNFTLRIIVDGEDRGELSLSGPGSPWFIIPRSIFSNAIEISVYNASSITTTTTSKPNVK